MIEVGSRLRRCYEGVLEVEEELIQENSGLSLLLSLPIYLL